MPHKSNPVTAEALQSIGTVAVAYDAGLSSSAVHAEERDGALWPVEWALMPSLLEAAGAAFDHAQRLLETTVVDADAMRARVAALPEVRSEAAVFALAATLGRVAAGQVVTQALAEGRSLVDLLAEQGGDAARQAISDRSFIEPAAATARQIFATRLAPNEIT